MQEGQANAALKDVKGHLEMMEMMVDQEFQVRMGIMDRMACLASRVHLDRLAHEDLKDHLERMEKRAKRELEVRMGIMGCLAYVASRAHLEKTAHQGHKGRPEKMAPLGVQEDFQDRKGRME